MGQRLNSAVEAYNSSVGSLERQVMPKARRFTELGVTASEPLPELEPIEQLARKSGPLDLEAADPDDSSSGKLIS